MHTLAPGVDVGTPGTTGVLVGSPGLPGSSGVGVLVGGRYPPPLDVGVGVLVLVGNDPQ